MPRVRWCVLWCVAQSDAKEEQTKQAMSAGSVFSVVFAGDVDKMRSLLDADPELVQSRGALGETLLHLVRGARGRHAANVPSRARLCGARG